jgi:hypothetical protein
MSEELRSKPRRRAWKILVRIVIALAVVLVAAVVLLPSLMPQSIVRRQVAAALKERLGRPVTVEWARFGWGGGLEVRGLSIRRGEGADETTLARADVVTARFNPVESLKAVLGGDPPLDFLRVEGLEVWLAPDDFERWQSPIQPLTAPDGTSAPEGQAARPPRAIQVTGGTIHFENKALGRSLTLGNLHASLGQLESTGQGYVNLEAALPGAQPGQVRIWAGLESLDLAGQKRPAGSFTIEWTGAAWSEILDVITGDADLKGAMRQTSGRVACTFGRGGWAAEGAVTATAVTIPQMADWPGLTLPDAVLGFQVRQTAAEKPIEVGLVKFSAPGINLKASGVIHPETSLAALVAPAAPEKKATAKPKAKASSEPPPPPPQPRPPRLSFHATGSILWAPLCQSVPALKSLADRFEQLSGGAEIAAHLESNADGLRLTGYADLLHTQAAWAQSFKKEAGRAMRLEVDAQIPETLSAVDLARLELITEAGHAIAKGHLAAPAPEGTVGRRLAGAWVEVRADIRETETLLAMLPGLTSRLAPVEASGPMEILASCRPVEEKAATEAKAPSPAWIARVRADMTATRLTVTDHGQKRPNVQAVFDATAVLDPDGRQINVFGAGAALAGSSLRWEGVANMLWTETGSPTARFEGTLKAAALEAALPVLAPGRFEANDPPVAGAVTLDVLGDLTEGQLRGQVKADLASLKVHIGDYFVKPAGQAASVGLSASWRPEMAADGGTAHRVLAEADVRLPGARVQLFGRGAVEARWKIQELAEEDAGRQALVLSTTFSPDSTLEARVAATDLGRALAQSPALERGLEGQVLEGSAEAALAMTLKTDVLQVTGSADLTGAVVRLAQSLNKPAAMPMKLEVALAVSPPQEEALEVRLSKFEVRLGDSVAGASGRVKVLQPHLSEGPLAPDQILSLLKEADLEVRGDIRHTPEFRKALPCLEAPLYSRADLDGLTSLAASFSGTPLRGKVKLEFDGTACKILHGQAILKPAGTTATARLDVRYGEAPGELFIDDLALKLADSTVSAEARLLFDNPRLTAPEAPSAWTLHVEGRAPDAAALAALFPARLGDMNPSGGITFKVRASGDPAGAELQSCDLSFDKASLVWLGKPCLINGPISYDGQRLATEGLNIVAGRSNVTLVAYIMQPDRAPTGSVILRGKALAWNELEDLIEQTSEHVAAWAEAAAEAASEAAPPSAKRTGPQPLSEQLALYGQHVLARAQLSCQTNLDRITITVPSWEGATYELVGVTGEGRLADQVMTFSGIKGTVNDGNFLAEVILDCHAEVPVLTISYDGRDLKMQDNLKPFVESTFPGMQVFGVVSQRNSNTRRLTGKAYATGHGETILTDGLLEGPAAPAYITDLLPGLKLTQYRFKSMSSVFEDKGNGEVVNRMIFEGRNYDIYIFGTSNVETGRVDYSMGVDLSVSLGSKVITRTLDQGKLPIMYATGRIKGSKFAEFSLRYLLPYEFAYEVFIRRNLLLELFTRIGEKPPRIEQPQTLPAPEAHERAGGPGSPG